jgi:hypothetical protein
VEQITDMEREFSHIHVPKAGGSWVDDFFHHAFPDHLIHSSHGSLSNLIPAHWIAYRAGLGPFKDGHPIWDTDWHHKQLEWVLYMTTTPDKPGRFDASVKFSTCRNPFDWLVSYYHSGEHGFGDIRRIHGIRSFEEFVEKFSDPEFEWYHYGLHKFVFFQQFDHTGACGMDWILRMEKLKSAIDTMLLHHGAAPEQLSLLWKSFGADHRTRDSGNFRPHLRKHEDHRFYYDDRTREIAEKRFRAELSLYRYDFDGPTDDKAIVEIPNAWGPLVCDPAPKILGVMNR